LDIHYHTEDIDFTLPFKEAISGWLLSVIRAEGFLAGELNYIFCSDAALLAYNQQFLQHDTLTDVITFDYCYGSGSVRRISGDIFISIDRIQENALTLHQSFQNELTRIMVHGLLHLCGYKDKSKAAKREMTQKEDFYLALLLL